MFPPTSTSPRERTEFRARGKFPIRMIRSALSSTNPRPAPKRSRILFVCLCGQGGLMRAQPSSLERHPTSLPSFHRDALPKRNALLSTSVRTRGMLPCDDMSYRLWRESISLSGAPALVCPRLLPVRGPSPALHRLQQVLFGPARGRLTVSDRNPPLLPEYRGRAVLCADGQHARFAEAGAPFPRACPPEAASGIRPLPGGRQSAARPPEMRRAGGWEKGGTSSGFRQSSSAFPACCPPCCA